MPMCWFALPWKCYLRDLFISLATMLHSFQTFLVLNFYKSACFENKCLFKRLFTREKLDSVILKWDITFYKLPFSLRCSRNTVPNVCSGTLLWYLLLCEPAWQRISQSSEFDCAEDLFGSRSRYVSEHAIEESQSLRHRDQEREDAQMRMWERKEVSGTKHCTSLIACFK